MEELIQKAMEAREKAYAPYSGFMVGAALQCADGTVYTGCNIENAGYTPTNCAERTAFFKAVSEGKREFVRIAIVGGRQGEMAAPSPCGVCLQVMAEFCDPAEFEIVCAKSGKEYTVRKLGEMCHMDLPKKFCDEMKRILGEEYPAYLASMEDTRKYGLRVNTAKISVEDFLKISPFELTPIPYVDNGFYYDPEVAPAKHPYYFAGLYYLQDPSAMTPASRLPVEEGDVVLDLCAAPGGKATELAAKLHGTGLLIANDISSKRAKALLKNIELFGVENSFIVTEYPQKLQEYFTGFFDKILIDAPCSGEGMFRKEPSMVKAWEQNGPEFYAKLQEEILRQALPMLKPGGYLLYSTCTFSPLEDEGTVDKILSMDDSMEIVPMQGYVGFSKGNPAWVDSSRSEIEDCIRIFPHKLDGEGHFLALFHKKETAEGAVQSYDQRRSGLKGEEKRLFQEFAAGLAREFEPDRMESKQGMVYYMPKQLPDMKGLRFLRSGLFLGEMKKNRFEPSQSLAMALKKSEYKNCLDLSSKDERVIRYLKGETLTLTQEEAGKDNGWVLVCVDGYPLGWGKKNKSSLKNKYHSGWRMM